jgi:hypothetical protein
MCIPYMEYLPNGENLDHSRLTQLQTDANMLYTSGNKVFSQFT